MGHLEPDWKRRVMVFTYNDEVMQGDEWYEVERKADLPATVEVCGRCGGTGKHDHPAFSNGLGEDQLGDFEFMEGYHSGNYDVNCEECAGRNVQMVVDAEKADPTILEILYRYEDDLWASQQEEAAERRMGC